MGKAEEIKSSKLKFLIESSRVRALIEFRFSIFLLSTSSSLPCCFFYTQINWIFSCHSFFEVSLIHNLNFNKFCCRFIEYFSSVSKSPMGGILNILVPFRVDLLTACIMLPAIAKAILWKQLIMYRNVSSLKRLSPKDLKYYCEDISLYHTEAFFCSIFLFYAFFFFVLWWAFTITRWFFFLRNI